jgi:hypothetical protein
MLKIEYVDINELKEYSNNAKLHPDEQIEQIKQSIKDFGMNDPLAIDKNNVIIEGHGRLIACRQLGIEQVPVIRLNELTEEQRKAYTLVHNKLTMNSDFDIDVLQDELSNIIDFDMESYGFEFLDDDEEVEEVIEPEVQFTEVLGEEHNYIVLYFDNDVDWLQICSLLDISEKKNLSTRKDGYVSHAMERKSVGRVFKGNDVLERLREQFENLD